MFKKIQDIPQADTDKWTKQQKEGKETKVLPKKYGVVSSGPTKDIDPRKRRFGVVGESFTRVPGRKRGKQYINWNDNGVWWTIN